MPGETLKEFLFDKIPRALGFPVDGTLWQTVMMGNGNLLLSEVWMPSIFDAALFAKDYNSAQEDGFTAGEIIDLTIKAFGLVTNGDWGNKMIFGVNAKSLHGSFEAYYEQSGIGIKLREATNRYYHSFYPPGRHRWMRNTSSDSNLGSILF